MCLHRIKPNLHGFCEVLHSISMDSLTAEVIMPSTTMQQHNIIYFIQDIIRIILNNYELKFALQFCLNIFIGEINVSIQLLKQYIHTLHTSTTLNNSYINRNNDIITTSLLDLQIILQLFDIAMQSESTKSVTSQEHSDTTTTATIYKHFLQEFKHIIAEYTEIVPLIGMTVRNTILHSALFCYKR